MSVEEDVLEDLAEELVEQGIAVRDGNALVSMVQEVEAPADSGRSVDSAAKTDEVAPVYRDAGERRQLTVMFCDIVGSTEMSQRLDPEELSELVRAYRAVCVDATKRYDGHVAQYLGDGVMIYFGYPQAHEDDAGRAIRAGLEIQRMLRESSESTRVSSPSSRVRHSPRCSGECL